MTHYETRVSNDGSQLAIVECVDGVLKSSTVIANMPLWLPRSINKLIEYANIGAAIEASKEHALSTPPTESWRDRPGML